MPSSLRFFRDSVINLLLAAGQILCPQTQPQVKCQGELTRTTDDELELRYRRDSEGGNDRAEPPSQPAAVGVADKMLLTRHQGFLYEERRQGRLYQTWGHSVSFESTFPRFKEESSLLRELNLKFRDESKAAAAEFGYFQWSDVIEGFLEPSYSQHHFDRMIHVEVVHQSPAAVSVLEHDWEYTGGVHGNGYSFGRNFVLVDDHVCQLKLEDLFDPNRPWKDRLITHCRDGLRSQKARWMAEPEKEKKPASQPASTPVQAEPFEDAKSDDEETDKSYDRRFYRSDFGVDDLRSFTISPSGLRFYFSTYQVGPYCDGEYSVKAPISLILDCIPTKSPARLFMKEEAPK